jgi:hypothetical protein
MRKFFLVGLAAFFCAGLARAQGEGETPSSRPAEPATKDRYSLARPMSLERFRSVFAAYDLNGDGKISKAEARAGGMAEARFLEYDLDRNGVIDADEFDLSYGSCLRRRGQALEGPLQERLAQVARIAAARGWRLPAPKEGESPVAPPNPNETRGSEPPASAPKDGLGRRRYGAPAPAASEPNNKEPNDRPAPRTDGGGAKPEGATIPRSSPRVAPAAGSGTASRPARRR